MEININERQDQYINLSDIEEAGQINIISIQNNNNNNYNTSITTNINNNNTNIHNSSINYYNNNNNNNNNSNNQFPWNKLWNFNIPSKIKFLIWKVYYNALPTKDNLIKRNMNVDPICPVCNVHNETILHSLVTCPIIEKVWYASSLSLRISPNNANDFKEWIYKWFREENFKTKKKKGYAK